MSGTVLAAILLAAFGRQVIGWWVGPSLFVGGRVLLVFCVMLLIATPIHSAALVLAGLGRHKAPAIGGGIEAALNLALSILLVRQLGCSASRWERCWPVPRRTDGSRRGPPAASWASGSETTSGPPSSQPPPALVAGAMAALAAGRAASPVAAALGIALVAAGFGGTFWSLSLAPEERRGSARC